MLTLRSGLGTRLSHLLALLTLTAGLAAHLLTLLATLTALATLAHRVELSQSLALSVHRAGAVTLLHVASLAIETALIHLTLALAVYDLAT